MGVFTVEVRVTKPGRRPRWKMFRRVLVDRGSEMTWLPESDLRAAGVEVFKRDRLFVMANGRYVTRNVGTAVIECGEFKAVDEVVLGQTGDLSLLGARTLEGVNAVVDGRGNRGRTQSGRRLWAAAPCAGHRQQLCSRRAKPPACWPRAHCFSSPSLKNSRLTPGRPSVPFA